MKTINNYITTVKNVIWFYSSKVQFFIHSVVNINSVNKRLKDKTTVTDLLFYNYCLKHNINYAKVNLKDYKLKMVEYYLQRTITSVVQENDTYNYFLFNLTFGDE
jgi:hypothetical protein